MIIVPTEKQFDWKHAPVVLFALVFLNLAIFFVYQSSDQFKLFDAVQRYQQLEYLDAEWPLVEDFLNAQGEEATLREWRKLKLRDEQTEQELVFNILAREDFYRYLRRQARNRFYDDFYIEWRTRRARIQSRFNSASYIAWGLRGGDMKPWTLLTYQFLHGGILHLVGNMAFLVICGFAVEAAIGHKRFLVFYLLSGLFAGLAHWLVDTDNRTPLVGASGAVSGVMAMYLAIYRLKKIEFFYWVLCFVGYFRAPAMLILPFYVGKEVYAYFANPDSNVAFMAHAGGFISGAAMIAIALKLDPKLLNRDYLETDTTIDPKQQQLAPLYEAVGQYRFEQALSLLDDLLVQYPRDFELLLLRYNLQRLTQREGYEHSVLALLQLKRATPDELKKLQVVWQENKALQNQLGDEPLIHLGMQFCQPDNVAAAEELFHLAQSRTRKPPSLGIFATKLANTFAEMKEFTKKKHYDDIAGALMQDSNHGVL